MLIVFLASNHGLYSESVSASCSVLSGFLYTASQTCPPTAAASHLDPSLIERAPGRADLRTTMDTNKAVVGDNHQGLSSPAMLNDKQKVEFWMRMIDAGRGKKFIDILLRHQRKEDEAKAHFCEPPSANKQGLPLPANKPALPGNRL